MLEFTNIYPMDAVYDTPEDVPEDVRISDLVIQAPSKNACASICNGPFCPTACFGPSP